MMKNTTAAKPSGITPWVQERRRQGRAAVSMPVRLRGYDRPQWRPGICTDINETGIGLDTAEVLRVGEVVEIELLESDGPISIRGRVLYRQMQHYGLLYLEANSSPEAS